MNIRPSLKLYLLIMMITTGVTTISIMSVVSFNYFLMGLDFSMYGTMRSQAMQQPVHAGQPIVVNGFTVASRWKDLPMLIRDNLHEQDLKKGELLKFVDGNPFFARPKAGYFVIRVIDNGQKKFVSKIFINDIDRPSENKVKPYFNYIIWIALIAITLFSLVPYFVLRNVASPIEKLMDWAKQLNDKEKLAQPIPDFQYRELNSLANIIQNSQQSLQQSLAREQRFLGYASHELRTPIAVTRTNTELLRKMISKEISVEKQQQVVDRIERACLTMTDLTETLLWLNRQSDISIPVRSFAIGALSKQLLSDLNYLSTGKKINTELTTDDSCALLPEALCRIIITNLIRNALQHTQQGVVSIIQSGTRLSISNQNIDIPDDALIRDEDLGFGLGLELTKRLVQHYGWQYKSTNNDSGYHVEIDFNVLNDQGS